MKSIILALLILLTFNLKGQGEREEISGISKQVETADYYQTQSLLWQNFARENPGDANAWYQFYKAERAFYQTEDYQSWIRNNQYVFDKLEHIIKEAATHLPPENIELLIMKASNTNATEKIDYLKKAFSIDPDRKESHEGLLVHYAVRGQNEEARMIAKEMMEENYFSYANLMWNTNALMSTSDEAIFIGFGDMDVIPKWVLQYACGIREDVSVISLWKLANDKLYQKQFFSKYKIPNIDLQSSSSGEKETDVLLDHILENSKVPIYMSCGSDISSIRQKGKSKYLYVNGMNLKYSEKAFNNTDELVMNFEKVFSLDYLFYDYQNHQDDEAVRNQLHLAYLPGIQKIIQIMEDTGKGDRASYYRKIAETIVEESGRREDVERWFSNL